ncbi:hypothetical protein EON64_03805 [archaeon]|nr:MAG: hypothetical protein EON64_03805 [archaeon]
MRAELAACRMDLDQAHVVVQREREEKAAALRNLEELRAYLERIKTLHASHSESAINIEYLKTCVFRFMASSSASERQRLAPVISTILNFTSSERHQIEELHRPTSNTRDGSSLLGDNTLSDIGSSLESWLGINPNSLFGSGT